MSDTESTPELVDVDELDEYGLTREEHGLQQYLIDNLSAGTELDAVLEVTLGYQRSINELRTELEMAEQHKSAAENAATLAHAFSRTLMDRLRSILESPSRYMTKEKMLGPMSNAYRKGFAAGVNEMCRVFTRAINVTVGQAMEIEAGAPATPKPNHPGGCACGCCHHIDHGACQSFHAGMNGRCVGCDHGEECHPGKDPKSYNTPI